MSIGLPDRVPVAISTKKSCPCSLPGEEGEGSRVLHADQVDEGHVAGKTHHDCGRLVERGRERQRY
jgi:hypothetical protein